MPDLVDVSQSFDEFIDKFRSLVAGDFLRNSMLADDFFVNECEDGLCVSCFQCLGFDPFCEVIDGDNNVSLSSP